jgi:hypothetical protein
MLTTFVPADHHGDGFDGESSPPWLILPDEGERRVHLLNGSTMSLHIADPSVATAKFARDDEPASSRRTVIIEGVDYGETIIEAKLYGHVKTRLHVSYYPERTVRVNFYRVEDENGDVPIFDSSNVAEVIKELNRIYRHQANLHFHSHLIKEFVRVHVELVAHDPSKHKRQQIFHALRDKAHEIDPAPQHYHVFWVKEYGAFDKPCCNVLGEADHIPSRLCIVEDVNNPVEQLQIVAHELGHCLGAHHDKEHHGALMYPYTSDGANRKLYKKTVEEIRGEA